MEDFKYEFLREIQKLIDPRLKAIQETLKRQAEDIIRHENIIEAQRKVQEKLVKALKKQSSKSKALESLMFKMVDVLEELEKKSKKNEEEVFMILHRLPIID